METCGQMKCAVGRPAHNGGTDERGLKLLRRQTLGASRLTRLAATSSVRGGFGEVNHFSSSRKADVWLVAGMRLEFAFRGEGNGLNCGCPDTAAEGEKQHENDLRSV
jgi:hypothetical protein